MDIVDTNIDMACMAPQALQRLGQSGRGQCLVRSSIRVRGVPTQQSRASETARFTMNMFRTVRIAGFLTTWKRRMLIVLQGLGTSRLRLILIMHPCARLLEMHARMLIDVGSFCGVFRVPYPVKFIGWPSNNNFSNCNSIIIVINPKFHAYMYVLEIKRLL